MDAVQICPRCGYDLSGAVAAWADRCPLTGVCSECGLEHQWADVLNPMLTAPHWSFEHARGRIALRLGQTCLWGLAPWVIWRRLRMEHPVAGRRLVILVLAWFALGHLALGLGGMVTNYQQALSSGSAASATEAIALALPALGWPYADREWYGLGWRSWEAHRPVGVATVLAFLPFVLAPLVFLLLPDSLRQAKVRPGHLLRGAAHSAAMLPGLALVWAAMLTWAATGRAVWVWFDDEYLALGSAALVMAAVVWQWTHWWLFARWYLRLPHSALVAAVMLVLPALVVATLVTLIAGPIALRGLDPWWYWVARAVERAAQAMRR